MPHVSSFGQPKDILATLLALLLVQFMNSFYQSSCQTLYIQR